MNIVYRGNVILSVRHCDHNKRNAAAVTKQSILIFHSNRRIGLNTLINKKYILLKSTENKYDTWRFIRLIQVVFVTLRIET